MLSFVLIFINVVVFFLPYVVPFGGSNLGSFHNFLTLGWKENSAIRNGEYYRLLTSNFLHADIGHLFVNMFSLYNIGPTTVLVFGNVGFLLIYFVSGICSSLASFWFNPNPSVGASGAIFGLVGALLALAVFARDRSLLSSIVLVIVLNVAVAVMNPEIDNWGHLGGLVSGFAVATILLFLGFTNYQF